MGALVKLSCYTGQAAWTKSRAAPQPDALPANSPCRLPSARPADGRLRVRAVAHPRSPTGLKVTYQEGEIKHVSDMLMPAASLPVSQ